MAERKAKKILGPLATNPADWPPLQRQTEEHQATLEQLLDVELTAYWKAIYESDDMSSEERDLIGGPSDRGHAFQRALRDDMDALRDFIARAIAPDGRPVGKKIAAMFVRERANEPHKRNPTDHLHNAQRDPARQSKTEAVWEAQRAKAIMVRVYGRTPDGYAARTDLIVAAKRSGVEVEDIREWGANHLCPEDPWAIHHSDDLARHLAKR